MDSPLLPTLSGSAYPIDDPSMSFADLSISSNDPDGRDEDISPLPPSYISSQQRSSPSVKPRFSLFAPPSSYADQSDPEGEQGNDTGDEEEKSSSKHRDQSEPKEDNLTGGSEEITPVQVRERKLREASHELKQFNMIFDGFLEALESSRGHNERLAVMINRTSSLLDQYTALLGQTEHTQRLLFNPRWTGSSDDASAMAAEGEAKAAAASKALADAQAAMESARREEEQRQRSIAEMERVGDASRGRSTGSGGRGISRGGSTRGRGLHRPSVAPMRPASAGSSRQAGNAGTSGATGNYAHVKSSGYGPR